MYPLGGPGGVTIELKVGWTLESTVQLNVLTPDLENGIDTVNVMIDRCCAISDSPAEHPLPCGRNRCSGSTKILVRLTPKPAFGFSGNVLVVGPFFVVRWAAVASRGKAQQRRAIGPTR